MGENKNRIIPNYDKNLFNLKILKRITRRKLAEEE